MDTKKTVRSVLGFLVLSALVMAAHLVPHEAFESTVGFALAYSLFAALIPLLALVAEGDDPRRVRGLPVRALARS